MLRFDVPPVWSNVTRWEAFVAFLVAGAALVWSPWLMIILAVQGLVRGFGGHYKCPSHRMWAKLFESAGWGGKKENPGARMFANKGLFIASTVSVVAYAFGAGIWKIPIIALLICNTLEWAIAFCAACWVYGMWYNWFPPKNA